LGGGFTQGVARRLALPWAVILRAFSPRVGVIRLSLTGRFLQPSARRELGAADLYRPRFADKFPVEHNMDKSKKTRWEKRMLRWQITLAILIPLLFGVIFWFVSKLIR
jgi:hypothetical protein